jgi:hypothetical protein
MRSFVPVFITHFKKKHMRIKSCFKLDKTATETHDTLKVAF